MSLAVIGTRGWSFLSWRAYPKNGSTAVMRFAEARRAASIIMSSSITLSLEGLLVGCMMNTSSPRMWSIIFTKVSLSGKDSTTALPIGIDSSLQMDCARAGWALPVNILRLSIFMRKKVYYP